FRVRVATPAGLQVAAEIVRAEEGSVRGESRWDAADIAAFWRLANFGGASWIIERRRIPVALLASLDRNSEAHCWASVHPDAEGRGLGTWFLERAEHPARDAGPHRLHAGTFAQNAAPQPPPPRPAHRAARP